ncbi:MAG: hypothetical protein HKN23_21005 [Verrucomicrobiales bacterium]|nr:hypothetical protein [Verrucomicrobiales bacterium]
MKIQITLLAAAAIAISGITLQAQDKKSGSASDFLKKPVKGLELKSVGRVSFGPKGLLLVSDPASASVVAIDTGDTGPVKKLAAKVENVESKLIDAFGVQKGGVKIIDMAVNPESGNIWLTANVNPGNQPKIVKVDSAGKFSEPDLKSMPHVRMTLPSSENEKLRNVTDLAWGEFSVIVAGQSTGEFSNKIFQIPIPLEHGENAQFYSAETYHVAHRKWETKAPIQSFIPYEEDGKNYIVGAFACTPIAKFPLDDIETGAEVKGTSVVELGSGNRPRDMFTYRKDGEEWLVTNTHRFKKNLFGPSKFWAAKVKMSHLEANDEDNTNENAVRRNDKVASGPEANGMEVVEELFGAVLVSQLENAEVIVLRATSEEATSHDLELVELK